jgi:PAT family beta-lactamase induction signal transducer AmpG
MKAFTHFFHTYWQKPLLIILLLGFSSGLPLSLTASTLYAWLAESGVDKTTIGIFAAIAMPYSLKFLWAPVMDGQHFPLFGKLLGRRRGWILAMQIALAVSIATFTLVNTTAAPLAFGAIALAVAFFSASQDVVIDAYRVESLSLEQQGAAAAMVTLGYRLAMLVSGAGSLWLSDVVGWQMTYLMMAAIMGVCAALTLFASEPVTPHPSPVTRNFIKDSVIAPFTDFITREGWLAILAFVVLFKLADAFLGIMFNPFLIELGFTNTQIAQVVKVYGLVATIMGSFLGGGLVAKWGMYRTLMLTGICHMFTNLLLVLMAGKGADTEFLAVCVVSENLTAGMGTAAFVAYLSSLCRVQYTATQYALLSALASVARTMISTASGAMAETLGWAGFFAASSLMAIPSLVLLWWINKRFGVQR